MLHLRQLHTLHLQPVDLKIADGECVAIMGESGSGKSVLLRAVADLDPHQGDAAIDGQWCSQMPAPAWRQRVVYVPAESGWWHDSVRAHFPASLDWVSRLPELGLKPELANGQVSRLSTGERQRLALLRALSRPGVRALLLDEPTSGLDASSIQAVEAMLQGAMQGGVCVMMVTHNLDQAKRLAGHCYLLGKDGVLHEHQMQEVRT